MKKWISVSLILVLALLLSGCQRGLYLRFSGKKLVEKDVAGETDGWTEPGETLPLMMLPPENVTAEPSGELQESEAPSASQEPMNTDPPGMTEIPETMEISAADQTTTEVPTIDMPETTEVPATAAPTTAVPTTQAPTTKAPTTAAPTTQVPTTQAPTTKAPTTQAPTTQAPTTQAPTTQAPTTQAPTTQAPTTQAPTEDTAHTEANVERIEITKLPDKTVYDQYNELISTKGMILHAVWNDGFEKDLTGGWTVMGADGTVDPRTVTEGYQTIYVLYGGRSDSFTIAYHLAEDAPLRLVDGWTAGRVFYQGEYLKHLFCGAWVGSQWITVFQLTFSQERLNKTGMVTVRISYGKHTAERTFTVVPASQFVLTTEDLSWLRNTLLTEIPPGGKLTAGWLFNRAFDKEWDMRPANRPLVTDIIPDEEFSFDPEYINDTSAISITIFCRGLSASFCLF